MTKSIILWSLPDGDLILDDMGSIATQLNPHHLYEGTCCDNNINLPVVARILWASIASERCEPEKKLSKWQLYVLLAVGRSMWKGLGWTNGTNSSYFLSQGFMCYGMDKGFVCVYFCSQNKFHLCIQKIFMCKKKKKRRRKLQYFGSLNATTTTTTATFARSESWAHYVLSI